MFLFPFSIYIFGSLFGCIRLEQFFLKCCFCILTFERTISNGNRHDRLVLDLVILVIKEESNFLRQQRTFCSGIVMEFFSHLF